RSRRLPVGLLVPAALVALVALLASLQYKWLGQVSEAERDQKRTSLRQSAEEFADDFDRELTRVYEGLQPDGTSLLQHNWTPFAEKLDSWRDHAKYPQLVKAIYLATDSGTDTEFLTYRPESREFAPNGWPADLDIVKAALLNERDSASRAANAMMETMTA